MDEDKDGTVVFKGAKAASSTITDESPCKCIPGWIRVLLFIISIVIGFILCTISISKTGSKATFYALWCIGVPMAWLSGLFVKGFKAQFRQMTKSIDNIICNVLIVICFIINIILEAYSIQWYGLLFPYIILYASLIWYVLGLIPGIQNCLKGCLKGCFAGCTQCCKGK